MSSKLASDPTSLKDALIRNVPGSMYYIPNFITDDEESRLLAKVHYLPPRNPLFPPHVVKMPRQLC